MVAKEKYADASCRLLSTKALEVHNTYISHVTFWQYMHHKGINGSRGIHAKRKQHYAKPDTGEITGPNQLWAWDISFGAPIRVFKRLCQ